MSGTPEVHHGGKPRASHVAHWPRCQTHVTASATEGEACDWDSGAPEEDPWASKTSVLAALQEAGPMRAKRPHAEHDADDPMRGMALGGDDEDPLLSMGAERKVKKAKKEKKEKKEKDKEKKKKQVLAICTRFFSVANLSPVLVCSEPWLGAM